MKIFFLPILFILTLPFYSKSQDYFKNLEKAEIKQGKIVYWQYGLTEIEKEFAKEKVSREFGFSFSLVVGCVVTKKIIYRITKHNKRVDILLSSRIGKNWRDLFYAKVDSIHKIDTTLINAFYKSPQSDEYFNLLSKSTDNYKVLVIPSADNNVFYIKVFVLDTDWNVTDKTVLRIKSTFPSISFKKED